jgi:uncharacterized membrane protein
VLIFVSMIMLVYFVHHLAHSIQVDQVLKQVERETVRVVEEARGTADQAPVPAPPPGAAVIPAGRSGYVQTFHLEGLAARARQYSAVVAVVPMIGEHVVAGAPLARAWSQSGAAGLSEQALRALAAEAQHGIRVGFERTAEQDAAFGVRQLADIASKALSPAVNDPYTAVQAVDHLSVVLSRLATTPLGPWVVRDGDGTVRVHVAARDWSYFLDLGLGQVRRYGHQEPRVVLALLRVSGALATFCNDERRRELCDFVRVLLDDVSRDVPQVLDRQPLLERGNRLLAELAQADAEIPGARDAAVTAVENPNA